MALPDVGDVIQLTIEAEHDNSEIINNVYDFKILGGSYSSVAEWQIALLQLTDDILTIVDGLCTALTVWKRIRAKNISTGDPTEHIELGADVPGTVAGDCLPAGVAILTVFRTDRAKTNLRKYIGPTGETLNDADGQWTTAALTGTAAFAALLSAAITTTYAVFEYGHYDQVLLTWHPPLTSYIAAEPAYQRRRRRGVGI